VPDAYSPRPPIMPAAAGGGGRGHIGMLKNIREQVARTLREFRLEPKG
jgi:hypothetical protein